MYDKKMHIKQKLESQEVKCTINVASEVDIRIKDYD